jgi:hypothetical protein
LVADPALKFYAASPRLGLRDYAAGDGDHSGQITPFFIGTARDARYRHG